MKNLLTVTFLIVISISATSQGFNRESTKVFCVSTMIGASLPFDNYANRSPHQGQSSPIGYASEGVKINFLDMTYRVHKNFGLAVSWTKLYHEQYKRLSDRDFYFNTGYLAGPMVFADLDEEYLLGIKFLTGMGTTKLRDIDYKDSNMAYNVAFFLYHDFNEMWRLMGSADVYVSSIEIKYGNTMKTLGVTAYNFMFGIGFRF